MEACCKEQLVLQGNLDKDKTLLLKLCLHISEIKKVPLLNKNCEILGYHYDIAWASFMQKISGFFDRKIQKIPRFLICKLSSKSCVFNDCWNVLLEGG